jgi:HEAT repeat protein
MLMQTVELLVAVILAGPGSVLSAVPQSGPSDEIAARELVQQIAAGLGIDDEQLATLRNTKGGTDRLVDWAVHGSLLERKSALRALAEMEPRLVKVQHRLRVDPHLRNAKINAQFISSLSDPDADVRNTAAATVTRLLPDSAIQARAEDIVAAAERFDIDDIALILGRTGSPKAKAVLISDPKFRRTNAHATDLALARLGDKPIEDKLIQAFANARAADRMASAARDLGYVGSQRCAQVLAQAMRSDVVRVLPSGRKTSIRIDIIKALSRIFPDEQLLWQPVDPAESDTYYEQIEKWCQNRLGVKWDRERPPFLYETVVPIPRPPQGKR